MLKNLFLRLLETLHGVRDLALLNPRWTERVGNDRFALGLAVLLQLIGIPVGAATEKATSPLGLVLSYPDRVLLNALAFLVTVVVVYLLAALRRKRQYFPRLFAGLVYAFMLIALVMTGVELGLHHPLQDVPASSVDMYHLALIMVALWMLVQISFVFKAALEIGAACSLAFTAVLIFCTVMVDSLMQMYVLGH